MKANYYYGFELHLFACRCVSVEVDMFNVRNKIKTSVEYMKELHDQL